MTNDTTMTTTSPLLALPTELRNNIYEYVVHSNPVIDVSVKGHVLQPPLAGICKQIRGEFLGIFNEVLPGRAEAVDIVVQNYDLSGVHNILDVLDAIAPERAQPPMLNVELTFKLPAAFSPDKGLNKWLRYCAEQAPGTLCLGPCTITPQPDPSSSDDHEPYLWVMKQIQASAFSTCIQNMLAGKIEPRNIALVSCRMIGEAFARFQRGKEESALMDAEGWEVVEKAARAGNGWAVVRLKNECRVSGYDAMDEEGGEGPVAECRMMGWRPQSAMD